MSFSTIGYELAGGVAVITLNRPEVMNALSLALVRKHFPQLAQPLGPRPWTVLLELSDSEGEEHARTQFEGLLEEALERGAAKAGVTLLDPKTYGTKGA